MIFATYSITDERKEAVDFAGPYFVAGQDLLVRADDNDITGPEDLNGKNLCSVTGSTSAQQIKDELRRRVTCSEQPGYAECVDRHAGRPDRRRHHRRHHPRRPAPRSRPTRASSRSSATPFSEEKLRRRPDQGHRQVRGINAAINKMIDDRLPGRRP